MVHPVAERLDILMSLVLSYMKDVCYVDGKVDNNKTKDLYRDLINIFDKLLLPTHASCHVQFFMFYLCSFKLGFAEAFLEHLWKKLQDPSNPAIIRQAAGNYIGSFLARAKFIPLITVKSCLDLLVNWLHIYLNYQDSGTKAFCDVALHGAFYSACQAVFYTFVFRHKQLLSGNLKEGLRYLQSLNFERIVMSQLNPLKVCLPSVVNFFAAITSKYQLVFCYTIIERNNRQMLPVIRSTAGGDSVQTCTNPLDTFFPFDPCVLKRCIKRKQNYFQGRQYRKKLLPGSSALFWNYTSQRPLRRRRAAGCFRGHFLTLDYISRQRRLRLDSTSRQAPRRGGAGRGGTRGPRGRGGWRPGAEGRGAVASLGLPGRPPPRCRCSSRRGDCGCRSPTGTWSEPTRFWRARLNQNHHLSEVC
ncbi:hypothetical protein H8959_020725 [Pygathrix nigripes]